MTRNELYEFHKVITAEANDLLIKKNKDYSVKDAFGNLKQCERYGLTDAATGVLVRVSDKFSRLCNLNSTAASVADENERDTVIDMINYLVIYLALRFDGADG